MALQRMAMPIELALLLATTLHMRETNVLLDVITVGRPSNVSRYDVVRYG